MTSTGSYPRVTLSPNLSNNCTSLVTNNSGVRPSAFLQFMSTLVSVCKKKNKTFDYITSVAMLSFTKYFILKYHSPEFFLQVLNIPAMQPGGGSGVVLLYPQNQEVTVEPVERPLPQQFVLRSCVV